MTCFKSPQTVTFTCFVPQDGSFLLRKSSGVDAQQPYTLVVFYSGRVYNIPVRYITSSKQFALGKEKLGEEVKKPVIILNIYIRHDLLTLSCEAQQKSVYYTAYSSDS